MTDVLKSAWQMGWGPERQEAFGTGVVKGDLDKFETFQEPLQIKYVPLETYDNSGQVGTGHEWPTYRGVLKEMITIDIPVQPLGSDFMGMLICSVFNQQVTSTASSAYTHMCEWVPLSTTAAADVSDGTAPGNDGHAWIRSLAILEEGLNEKLVQDVAVVSVTLRGDGSNRIECGASLIASGVGSDLTSVTWPTAVTPNYIYNSACTAFTNDANTITDAQMISWELVINSPVDMNRAWIPASTEATRKTAQAWPLLPFPDRNFTFNCKIEAKQGDLPALRAEWLAQSTMNIDFTFIGGEISGSDPAVAHGLICTIPDGVLTDVSEEWSAGGMQLLNLAYTGDYDAGGTLDPTGCPIAVSIRNGEAEYQSDET